MICRLIGHVPSPARSIVAPVLLVAALLPSTLRAQPWTEFKRTEPPPHTGETITFEARGDAIKAYLVKPEGRGPHPGMVVIHEWWGLNDQILGVADRLAEAGYTAIVPDLYGGKLPGDLGWAHDMMEDLDEDWAVDVIEGAGEHLRSLGDVKARAIGTIGFGMGGRLSLAAALDDAPFRAAVVYYGYVVTDKESLASLKTPLLGIFGRDDRRVLETTAREFESALEAAGVPATILVYPSGGHAFFNEQRPSFVREVADDAWARTRMFLDEHLKGKRPPRARRKEARKVELPDR